MGCGCKKEFSDVVFEITISFCPITPWFLIRHTLKWNYHIVSRNGNSERKLRSASTKTKPNHGLGYLVEKGHLHFGILLPIDFQLQPHVIDRGFILNSIAFEVNTQTYN